MASLTWIDTKGKRYKPRKEYTDIKSLRSYIKRNRDNIKVVESLDCNPLDSLYDESTRKGLFEGCINLVEVKDVVGTSKIKNVWKMFYGCENLKSVPLFTTSKVENMSSMFSCCDSLESVPYFDTSNVKNMSFMVYRCSSLENVPLFNTSSVENMSDMFTKCRSLKSYTLPCDEYNTRSSAIKIYEDLKKSEKMLEKLNELWQD